MKKNGCALFLAGLIILSIAGCASMEKKEPVAKETPASSSQIKKITGITISGAGPAGAEERILLTSNSLLDYTSVKEDNPLGIVFLFPKTTFGNVQSQYMPKSNIIASIKTAMASQQKGARIEVLLKKDSGYAVKRSGNDMEISFFSNAQPVQETSLAEAVQPEESKSGHTAEEQMATPTNEPKSELAQKEGSSQAVQKEPSNEAPAIIDRIDFSSQGTTGKSSVIVGTTHPVNYEITKISDRALKLRVFNSRLPEFRQHRPLITTSFDSAIDRISPMQVSDMKNTTDIIIDLRQLVPYRPVKEGNTITVNFDPSSIRPRTIASANLPEWQQALVKPENSKMPASAQAAQSKEIVKSVFDQQSEGAPVKGGEELPNELQENKVYTGQKIALDFYETDIKNVFRILQQVSGKNYAVDKDVTGQVTLSLEKPVPWDQVLDLILQMNQLGSVQVGNIIRIARNTTLEREEKIKEAKLAAFRARQEQQRILEPIVTEFIPISYANAKKEILPKIKNLVTDPKKRPGCELDVDERNNQIIIHDTQRVIDKCKTVIAQIDKVTPQVLIEARIVEVDENYTRELGLSWGASGQNIYRSDLNGEYSYNIAMNTPFTGTPTSSGEIDLNFTRLDAWGTPIVLDAALKAMETEGEGKIISSPKILTLDNKVASIKQGIRVPYTSRTVEGVPTTKFEDAVLSLEVTPHMTPDNRISLAVATKKNDILNYSPLGEPVTSINEAQTELLVDNGETVVIGGVVKTDLKQTESGFPVLKDIPLLGWMFKDVKTDNTKQEILIFMTPRIVQLQQRNLVQSVE